jgi:hypothetical protein
MNRHLMTFCCLLFGVMLHAEDSQQEINNIKKSKRYVYAMAASNQSKEDAILRAKDLLLLEVEQWLKDEEQGDFAGYVVKVKNNASQIETQRGKLYRVFAYVAKKDVLPYYDDEEIETVKKDSATTVQQSAPVAAEPKVEQREEQLEEQREEQQPETPEVTLTAAEEEMLAIDKFDDIYTYVAKKTADGTITDYGKYLRMPKNEDVYVFVYDTQGNVPTKIKRYGGKSLNMGTLKEDKVERYEGCGAIWIKVKE